MKNKYVNFVSDETLYLYPETNGQQTIGQTTGKTPNLNVEIVKQIADKLGLTFTTEKETTKDIFAPIDILDKNLQGFENLEGFKTPKNINAILHL